MKKNDQLKPILIISSSFAPSGHVGAKRFTFLSEVFKQKVPEIHILTRKEKYANRIDPFYKGAGSIYRTNMWPNYPFKKNSALNKIFNILWVNYLCIIEPQSGWILPALTRGLKIIKKHKVGLIIATCPLFSSMIVGYFLSLIKGVNLILDYRDPWSNRNMAFCKFFGKRINRILEKKAINKSSAIVFTSPVMREEFNNKFGKCSKHNYFTITNGYKAISSIEPVVLEVGKKNMVYAGSLYGERRIRMLAKPLLYLLKENIVNEDKFCLNIFGHMNNDDRKVIKEYRLQRIIKSYTPVPYKKMLGYLKGADILLLMSGSNTRYAIPYKFFDYISVKKPILAIAPEDSGVQHIMNRTNCGRVSIIDNEKSILVNMRSMLLEQERYSFEGVEEYTWENIGSKYIRVIEEVMRKNKNHV